MLPDQPIECWREEVTGAPRSAATSARARPRRPCSSACSPTSKVGRSRILRRWWIRRAGFRGRRHWLPASAPDTSTPVFEVVSESGPTGAVVACLADPAQATDAAVADLKKGRVADCMSCLAPFLGGADYGAIAAAWLSVAACCANRRLDERGGRYR
jgi:hypothetical protein